MKIIKPNKFGVAAAVKVLKDGGVVVYPTDTAYALGGIFDSPKVASRILKIKKRKDKKFTLIASSLSQVEKYFKLNSLEKKLAQKFWPGPLSIVVSDRFAVRVPKNKIAQSLARGCGKPLIATSANISGGRTIYDSQKIIKQFADPTTLSLPPTPSGLLPSPKTRRRREPWRRQTPDLIIDAGRLAKIKTSTIVQADEEIKILRQGSVKV